MHVLVIPSWYAQYPGDPSGSFFETQAAGVQALGEQVGMIYPDMRSVGHARAHWRGGFACATVDGLPVLRYTYINWTPRIERLILPRWIDVGMRLFDEYCARFGKPDLIHAHCLLRGGILADRISRDTGIPFVVTEHLSRWHRHEVTPYEMGPARAAAKNARALISVSGALLSHLRQDLELGRMYVLPNAVDGRFLAGAVKEPGGKRSLTFINVALLNPGKRHDILIDAFHQAFGKDSGCKLHIVGDGPQRQAIEQRIAAHDLGASVRLFGMQDKNRVAELLGEADCFVLTSDHETFGVVVTEALAKGLPVVSTRCGGTDDIVTAENGILTEAGNVDAVAQALGTMRDRLASGFYSGARIRAACIEQFSQRSVCARLLQIYREALGQEAACATPAYRTRDL